MMAEPKKKGFWGGLFRSRSIARGSGKLEKGRPRRFDDEDDASPQRRQSSIRARTTSPRRRSRRPEPKGKGKEEANGHDHSGRAPLTEWPPPGVSIDDELSLGRAMELVTTGVPVHKGHRRPIAHASNRYYSLHATSAGNHGYESDAVNQHNSMTQLTTLRLQGSGPPDYPWETLEQPSLAFGFGNRPGTITLNYWTSLSSTFPPMIALRDPDLVPRDVDLIQIFDRLKDLEAGLEDEDEELLYRLYKRFLRDPDKVLNPHKTMDRQIMDLVMYLSSPNWTDFSNPKNQVVTKFIYDTGHANHQQYHKFFYQLLLSLELELRINSRQHTTSAKQRLMDQIPPKIQWNLALARRWRDYIRIEEYGKTADQLRLRYKLRKRQVKMLKRFAQMMKWPNLTETLDALRQGDADATLVSVSSHTMAFFSGLVLPGPTFPFLFMNSLIDIDPDPATDDLALLTHLHPHCGFQYRNSYTYWTSTCIVGKVLAPTCLEAGGWVGPARPTADLGRSQIARVRSKRPRQSITPEDVTSISDRSDPLGPPSQIYPASEYVLVTPDTDTIIDTIRIEMLSLRTVAEKKDSGPQWFDASIQFAISGVSWPLRLSYDVSFINAWPCSEGPHPLFFDYVYTVVKVDELMNVIDWGRPIGSGGSALSTPVGDGQPQKPAITQGDDEERVLVVEAFGIPDNEVLARAWCSHWGLSAVTADIRKTCMTCAIREAYAATLTVLILVEDQPRDHE
ncbi:hypothetical protein F5B20DRAFT_525546 [Whalleya microplaca]|nr:hypothetical protein F5B20DRAFT_525546 [Whalleya microplaca]